MCPGIIQPGGGFYLQPCAASLKGGAWIGYNYQPGFTHSSYIRRVDTTGNYDLTALSPSFFFSTVTYLHSIIPLVDSTYLVTAYSWSYNQVLAFFTCSKVDEGGNILWQNDYYNNLSPCASITSSIGGIDSDSAGNIYIVGNASEFDCPGNNTGGIFCMKLNSQGDVIFTKAYSSQRRALSIAKVHYKSGILFCQANYNGFASILIFDTLFSNSCYDPDSTIILNKVFEPPYSSPVTFTPPSISYLSIHDTITLTTIGNPVTMDLCTPLGVLEGKEETAFHLFPNPTTGKLKIKWPDGMNIDAVEIFSTAGKKILQYSDQDIINVSSLVPGIYILQIYSGDKITRSKIIKY